ncbi:Single-stranded-DNA-specific exonuclease RecJ [Methylacidimicrobium cyclopophantes]|uniref:Single-stranded-DNA-specific exonuclease RecJ n=1 Tax=Methylacidimicrobium cyclopophantes TaxID=1041766 RepID=A0A5E6MA68_9BACT|nr:single-stranded-DNA-specific exonuclease RecJ [Methylacidimicrobium cyclopophantes]VVM06098.1 Single-stranded-DNA-specific exonuclease RecJ [Methylacidimicrobium cyclopophantes]
MGEAETSQEAGREAETIWEIRSPGKEAEALGRELGVSPLLGGLLADRGCRDAERAFRFLNPRLADLEDPFRLSDLRKAADRLREAIAQKQWTLVYGDYDVDGVSSTSLLVRALRLLGAPASAFIPERASEGYGLTRKGLERAFRLVCQERESKGLGGKKVPDLVVAVDCGTTSIEELSWLAEEGIDALVVDHHRPAGRWPPAWAIVNPHRDGRGSNLASAGLVFKLLHGLLKLEPAYRERLSLREELDLVALGTIADVVPLTGDNRILVARGLEQLGRRRLPGLRALANVSNVGENPTVDDVAFRLAPRLNASGRLDDAMESVRLLLTDSSAEAEKGALSLHRKNLQRRLVEQEMLEEALRALNEEPSALTGGAIVVGKRGWHAGVAGVVASRLLNRFYRLVAVIAFNESGEGKGSARGIPGISIVEGLRASAGHLEKFGGHDLAAGFSLREENLRSFRESLSQWAKREGSPEIFRKRLKIAGEIPLSAADIPLYEELERLAPFGAGNARPLFAFPALALEGTPFQAGRRTRMILRSGEVRCEAFGFDLPRSGGIGGRLQVAGHLDWDMLGKRVRVRIVDWRAEPE